MKYLSLPLLALLLLGAGCATGSSVSSVVTNETPKIDTSVEEDNGMATYAMSGKVSIIFDAPVGWFVRQFDAGGASTVVIRESKDVDDQTTLSIHQPWPDEDEIQSSYEEWLVAQELSTSAVQKEIGSLIFDVWQESASSMTVYTAVLDQESPYYVLIQMPASHASITYAFLDSIVLFPTQDQLQGANRIPDSTVEDTR